MSNVVQGVPTPADWPATAGNFGTRVTENPNGTANATWKFARVGGHLAGAQNPWAPAHEYEAILSAHEMIDEHDQRITDSGQIPDLSDPYKRIKLWWDYYNVSTKQFDSDDANLAAGKPLQIIFSADGIPTFSKSRLAARRFRRQMQLELTSEQRELEEIIAYYGAGRTAAEISAVLPLDPFHRRVIQLYIDAQLPPKPPITPITPISTLPTSPVVTGTAPAPELGDINTFILRNPALPAVPSNMLGTQEMIDREERQAYAIISGAPEYYRDDEAKAAEQQAEIRDYFYWKTNYPDVRLVAAQNPGLRPEELATPWAGPGLAPLVMVQITPRQRPLPEKSWFLDNPWFSTVLSAIPVVGGIIAAGLSYETNHELKKWAGAWKPNASAFAPQFYPKPFQIPMPLDRAQIMVREPWYAPAMVDQFAAEVRLNNYLSASAAYAALFGAMMQNQPTPASALPASQGTAPLGHLLTTNQAASGSALPFLIAAGLLVAGAPVVVPIAIVYLASKAGKNTV